MRQITILNRVEKHKSFVSGEAKFERAGAGGEVSLVVAGAGSERVAGDLLGVRSEVSGV